MTDPTESPMPFKGDMVRAILGLDGRLKIMTRRIAKLNAAGRVQRGHHNWHIDDPEAVKACPYGQPGDRLWVRERMRVLEVIEYGSRIEAVRLRYEADGAEDIVLWPGRLTGTPVVGKCLSYGGFREASRIDLEITAIRIERLQDISQDDCLAEGIDPDDGYELDDVSGAMNYRPVFEELWDSINAKRGHAWDSNPWVWVVGFRRC